MGCTSTIGLPSKRYLTAANDLDNFPILQDYLFLRLNQSTKLKIRSYFAAPGPRSCLWKSQAQVAAKDGGGPAGAEPKWV